MLQGIGDFPFLWVQLAPYTGYAAYAGHGDVSTIRLAQADDMPHIDLDTTVKTHTHTPQLPDATA